MVGRVWSEGHGLGRNVTGPVRARTITATQLVIAGVLALGPASGCHDDATQTSAEGSSSGAGSSGGVGSSSSTGEGSSGGVDSSGGATTSGTDEASSGAPIPDLPHEPSPLTINEVMPGNGSTLNGPGGDTRPDWVELVNTSDAPVSLGRVQLRNAANEVWIGTDADGAIAPGEHFLVWLAPSDGGEGVFTGWSVSKSDDVLTLFVDDWQAETVQWSGLGVDVSWLRIPDATGDFVATALPSPAAINADAPSATLDPAQETVFLLDVAHRIDLEITPEISAMLDQPDRPKVHVEASIDGIHYLDVGVRLKGHASYDTMDGKPGFVVDMNFGETGAHFRGLSAFKLHNGSVIDPTRARDHITYRLARELGLLAPRVGWAEVYCSGEYYGIYIMVERHDQTMIEARRPGAGALGMIFEPTVGWQGDFGSHATSWDYEDGPQPMPAQAQDTLDAIDTIVGGAATDQAVDALWNYVDKDMLMTYMAWEAMVGNTDGYMAPNNWRLYIDGTTFKLELVPSGAEWTWDWTVSPWWFGGRLASFCNENTNCRHDYAARILEVADTVEALALLEDFDARQEWLLPYIQSDPRYPIYQPGDYWYPWGTYEHAYPSTVEHLTNNPNDQRNEVWANFPDLQ